jgi:hypothetical protein
MKCATNYAYVLPEQPTSLKVTVRRRCAYPKAKVAVATNFVLRRLIFVDSHYGTCSMSLSWRLKFWGDSRFLENLCTPAEKWWPCMKLHYYTVRYRQLRKTRVAVHWYVTQSSPPGHDVSVELVSIFAPNLEVADPSQTPTHQTARHCIPKDCKLYE